MKLFVIILVNRFCHDQFRTDPCGIGDGKPTQDQMIKMMGLGLGSALLMAFVLSNATVFAQSYLYEKKPLNLVWINSGYWLASMLVMGVIIAVWK